MKVTTEFFGSGFFQGLEMGAGKFSKAWRARNAPWEKTFHYPLSAICYLLFLALLICATISASAQVRVVKGGSAKAAIDWSRLVAGGGAATEFKSTLEEDLIRSGWFTPAPPGRAEFSLVGSAQAGGALNATIQLASVTQKQWLLSKQYTADAGAARRLAHKVADEILAAIGRKGMFSGRIVMVGTRSGAKELYVCDMDGGNLAQITSDKNICVGPRWSPDGNRITYTGFLKRYPDVYMIDLASRNRRVIASYPGVNLGGTISPDGSMVALVLSKDGSQGLYVRALNGGTPVRLTDTKQAAMASPSWAPDGSHIVYVSDQASTAHPQLYMISRSGGAPRRLTTRGSQNVAPCWGANGLIAYASLQGRFQICVMDPNTLDSKVITPGDADYEDPSWAPDGRHIVCSRTVGYHSRIYLLDTLGDPPVALATLSGDWYAPSVTAK
jgi:TolB protein